MTPLRMAVACTALWASAVASPGFAASSVVREFSFDPSRIELVEQNGITDVRLRGAMREFNAGRPDLPWLTRSLDVPEGMRVSSVEMIDLETAPLAGGVSVPSAIHPTPGLGLVERSAPDAAVFSGSGFFPHVPVELGVQGFQRGRAIAQLRIAAARWNPTSRQLEAVRRVRVNVSFEPTDAEPRPRERIVDAWERTPGAGRRAVPGAVLPRDGREAEPFRPTQIPSVLGSPVEYLIITNDAMAPEFQRLADWKTQSGIPAVVRTLSFIKQEYPYGSDDAERMRMFIADAYSRWGTKWVLLGGDTEVLPTRQVYTTFYGGEYIACDMYFSCLDGRWNADADSIWGEGFFSTSNPGDAVDLLPEVYVGRAPTVSLVEAKQFVDRSMQYVRTPSIGYQTEVLFFAEVLFPQNWSPGMSTSLDGAELAEEVLPSLQTNPSIRYARLYENHLDNRWEPGSFLESRQAVFDSLSVGYNISVHIGHGFRNVMSCGDANFDNDDALSLTNGNKLTNLYAINCTSNAIDFPCIGEAFLHANGGGAVTNVGSTRFDFPTAGRAYQAEYFRLLFEDSLTAVGEIQSLQKIPFIAFSTYDGVNRWTQMTLLLIGDPELRIYTGLPRQLSVSHPASVVASDTGFTVNVATGGSPLLGARVTAYKAGDEYSSVVTNGAGDAWIPFRPDSLGNFTLTVTGFDCQPYQAVVPVTASGTPVLADGAPVIDDDNVGGTSGDSNGKLDDGETVDLMIPLTNNGGGGAPSVTATLSSTDPWVTIIQPVASYGAIGVSGTGNPSSGFRISVPYDIPDQHEIAFQLDINDGGGGSHIEKFQLVAHGPDPFHLGHVIVDTGGNADARPDSGESVTYTVELKNLGTGTGHGMSAILRNYDGKLSITDSTSSYGEMAPGSNAMGDGFAFDVLDHGALMELRVSDNHGERLVQTIDLAYPLAPEGLDGVGAGSSIALTWARVLSPDLRGYNVYRSTAETGPFSKVNLVPTFRTAYYLDTGLNALTRYYYQVAAVDSSGNESDSSSVAAVSTNPPAHGLFPIPTNSNTPSSIAFDHAYSGFPVAIASGAEKLHVWHPDGSYPVDADGAGTTFGDFTTLGSYYAPGPSIANIDNTGGVEFIGPTWNPNADTPPGVASPRLYAFDTAGQLKPGFPVTTNYSIWSSAAIGDLNNDGFMEMAMGTNGPDFLVVRHDGTDWLDGDSNPSTIGVFKVLTGSSYNSGTPAIADLDGDGFRDIIFASSDGNLYAWRPDGSNLPGFPIALGSAVNASVAIGYLDGPGDTVLEIVVAAKNNKIHVFDANGTLRAGWPKTVAVSHPSRCPSPALADMNNDSFLDIVHAGTDGKLYVFNRDGTLLAPFTGITYSTLPVDATESSPVVADIDGDGLNDVIVGDDFNLLAGISGTGSVLPGFPIVLGSEVKATPGVCDCDGDGLSEIVAMTWGGQVYIWDYDFTFSPGGLPPWPQFHHDARRTGFYGAPVLVDVEPAPGPMVSQIEFAPPAPNPARGTTRMWFTVPADMGGASYEIAVYDLTGRRVQTLERGTARAGRFTSEWNLRDDRGSVVDAGVYFLRFSLGGQHLSRKLVVMH